MAKKPLNDLRRDKHNILTNAYRKFIDSMKRAEVKIFSLVTLLIRQMETDPDGSLIVTPKNRKLINSIRKEFGEFLKESSLSTRVRRFTNNFDEVDRLSTLILSRANNIPLAELRNKVDLSDVKGLYIDQITKGILSDDAIEVELINPIRQIAFRAANTGIKIEDAEKEIRRHLLGKGEKGGRLVNRSRFYANETIMRFNGAIQTEFCKKYDAKVFKILNPLIKTSVQNCVDMVEGTGEHGKLAIAPRTFLIEDIPKIIRLNNKMGVSVEGTTPENYHILRNHPGCLHSFECFIRSDEWVEQKKRERDERNSR